MHVPFEAANYLVFPFLFLTSYIHWLVRNLFIMDYRIVHVHSCLMTFVSELPSSDKSISITCLTNHTFKVTCSNTAVFISETGQYTTNCQKVDINLELAILGTELSASSNHLETFAQWAPRLVRVINSTLQNILCILTAGFLFNAELATYAHYWGCREGHPENRSPL